MTNKSWFASYHIDHTAKILFICTAIRSYAYNGGYLKSSVVYVSEWSILVLITSESKEFLEENALFPLFADRC